MSTNGSASSRLVGALGTDVSPSGCSSQVMAVRTVLDRGPKGKKVVALALDWPGWSRGAKTDEVALETLEAYRDRYRRVAVLAGMEREFDADGPLEVVEEKVGTGSVDFWAISFSPSA